jgi:hemerythrin superfamily protein
MTSPTPDILTTLRAEHEVIRALQELLLETEGAGGTRAQLWFRLQRELYGHALAEEEAVYDRLARIDSTADLAAHSIEEHRAIEELLKQLDHIGFDQPQWKATLERLVHMSNHHLAEEEQELFPWAGRVLSDAERASVAQDYRDAKQRILAEADDRLRATTRTGVDERTYESSSLDALKQLVRDRGMTPEGHTRSELISMLRDSPGTDAHH